MGRVFVHPLAGMGGEFANIQVGASFRYLTVNYGANMFPGAAPVKASGGPAQDASQRAIGPAQTLDPGTNDNARNGGRVLHEWLFRAGIAL